MIRPLTQVGSKAGSPGDEGMELSLSRILTWTKWLTKLLVRKNIIESGTLPQNSKSSWRSSASSGATSETVERLSESHVAISHTRALGVCRKNRISPRKLRDLRVSVLKLLRKRCTTEARRTRRCFFPTDSLSQPGATSIPCPPFQRFTLRQTPIQEYGGPYDQEPEKETLSPCQLTLTRGAGFTLSGKHFAASLCWTSERRRGPPQLCRHIRTRKGSLWRRSTRRAQRQVQNRRADRPQE